MASLVPYAVILIVGFLGISIASSLFNFVWTLLMSSYSLSLPALLWGGGAFNFPTFVPPTEKSPMSFYYWFFVIAVIVFVVAIAISSFRKLTFWGRFDQEQQLEESQGFWNTFKWIAALSFMTVLTPILIWICYSLIMLGVYFFMTLIGKNNMFLSISQPDFEYLLAEVNKDLSNIINTKTGTDTLIYKTIKALVDNSSLIKDYLVKAGADEILAKQYIHDLEGLLAGMGKNGTGLVDLQTVCFNFQSKLNGVTYDNPVKITAVNDFITDIAKLVNDLSGKEVVEGETVWTQNTFIGCWRAVFGNASDSIYAFDKIVEAAKLKGDVAKDAAKFVENWNEGSGIFSSIGYFLSGKYSEKIAADPKWFSSLDRLASNVSYTSKDGSTALGLNFLTFKSGSEIGLKTCPLTVYIDAIVGVPAGAFQALTLGKIYGVLAGVNIFMLGSADLQAASQYAVGTMFKVLGYVKVASGIFIVLYFFITMAISMLVYYVCIRIMIMPLLGMTVFLWQGFFEAMWHFFLLLPAIGASVADSNNKIFSTAWRHCVGKMCAVLLLWAGLLMMFAALFQINTVFGMIWDQGVKQISPEWSGSVIIEIKPNMGGLSFLQGLGITLQINFKEILKFALACVVLQATFKMIEKLGSFAFGQDVYGNMSGMLQNPLNGLIPGFAASLGAVRGMARKVGNSKLAGAAKNQVAAKSALKKNKAAHDDLESKRNEKDKEIKKLEAEQAKNGGKLSDDKQKQLDAAIDDKKELSKAIGINEAQAAELQQATLKGRLQVFMGTAAAPFADAAGSAAEASAAAAKVRAANHQTIVERIDSHKASKVADTYASSVGDSAYNSSILAGESIAVAEQARTTAYSDAYDSKYKETFAQISSEKIAKAREKNDALKAKLAEKKAKADEKEYNRQLKAEEQAEKKRQKEFDRIVKEQFGDN